MAFAASNLTAEPRAFSVGPLKMQLMTYSVASGDTSGTVTADALTEITHIMVDGVCAVASTAASFSGNVATLTFVNPAATRYGNIVIYGR